MTKEDELVIECAQAMKEYIDEYGYHMTDEDVTDLFNQIRKEKDEREKRTS